MAITGTGTQEDPYLVHNYTELKNPYPFAGSGTRYVKLANDINCNDYGTAFEWETIRWYQNSQGNTTKLDLDGHTIKNVPLKSNNQMFFLSAYGSEYDEIYNGKLRNIFTQPSSTAYIIEGNSTANIITDVSMSASLGNLSKGVFRNLNVLRCSLYLEAGGTPQDGEAMILYSTIDVSSSSLCKLSNCDIKVINNNMLNHITWTNSSSIGTNPLIDNCRIQGKIKTSGQLLSGWLSRGKLLNSVIDLDMSEASFGSMGYAGKWSCEDGSSGVINTDYQPPNQQYEVYFTRGMTGVTSAEIINGDALRAKGFTVVNVSG